MKSARISQQLVTLQEPCTIRWIAPRLMPPEAGKGWYCRGAIVKSFALSRGMQADMYYKESIYQLTINDPELFRSWLTNTKDDSMRIKVYPLMPVQT